MKTTMSLFAFLLAASSSVLALPLVLPLPIKVVNVLIATGKFAKVTPGIVEKLCKTPSLAESTLTLDRASLSSVTNDIIFSLIRIAPEIIGELDLNQDTSTPASSPTQQLYNSLQTLSKDIRAATSPSQLCQVMKDSVYRIVDEINEFFSSFPATLLPPCYKDLVIGFGRLIFNYFLLYETTPQQPQLDFKANITASLNLIITGLQCLQTYLTANDTQSTTLIAGINTAIQELEAQKAALDSIEDNDGLKDAVNDANRSVATLLSIIQPIKTSPP